jgi:hypothetical protein
MTTSFDPQTTWQSRMKLGFVSIVFIAIVTFGLYLLVVLNWGYSDGDRAGYLQKFSRKGWICKTYEGELAMTTVPGVAPVLWPFSVWDKAVAEQINGLLGKRVVVHYREYRHIPTSCFGETTYYVDRVELAVE